MTDLAQSLSEIRSLPDQALRKELSSPTGMLPGFLVISELHDRKNLRGNYMGKGAPDGQKTVAEEYAGSIQPYAQSLMQSQQQQPPQQPPMPPPQSGGIASLPPPQQGYASGGIVSLANGGQISIADYIT